MSLYADICRGGYVDEAEVSFDEAAGTWTLRSWLIDEEPIPGFPTRELAEAVGRALRVAYGCGADAALYS